MRGYLKFGVLVLVGALLAVLIILYRESAPELPLRLTLDKTVYKRGEPMVITIKNVSDRIQSFDVQNFEIALQKWDKGNWVGIPYFPTGAAGTGLRPGESAQLRGYVAPNELGRYRVASEISYLESKNNKWAARSNFVEFVVVE